MVDDSEEQGDTNNTKDEESSHHKGKTVDGDEDSAESEQEEDEVEEEDDEPNLKYARLTSHLGPVYRNGDATSAFLAAGDKMVGLIRATKPHGTECFAVYWNT